MRLAIIGGISDYLFQQKLEACGNDAATMRAFLDATKTYSDICILDREITGADAKKVISEFIQKHRGNQVEELLFYFSGHGDRVEDDFFYALSDYRPEKRESSGLRNSELDSLIRNLAPELTVKIVDACYSGSTYIKSEDDIGPVVQKSAKDNQLKKLYFFHSSAADQTSIAGPKFSWFTQAIFQSLVNQAGAVRYRDLLAAVADEMNQRGGPRPTFVVQADSLEIFVHMDAGLADLLNNALVGPPPHSTGAKDPAEPSNDELVEIAQTAQAGPVSLAELAAAKAKDVYCTQEEAENNVRLLTQLASSKPWPDRIKDVYEIQFREHEPSEIPNRISIGRWISSLKDDIVFAIPIYEIETYKVEEYKEMPKKPSGLGVFGRSIKDYPSSFRQMLGEDKEYKLETVDKRRQVLAGFEYTVNPVFKPHIFYFTPKFASMGEYAACVVCVFSRRLLTCLYSMEHLPYKAWNVSNPPLASKWKQHSAPLKNARKIEELVQSVMGEICDFIEADARQKLG